MTPITISVEDVAYHLSTLQTNKATGPYKIPAYFLKRAAPSIAPILATVFSYPCSKVSYLQTGK